MIVVPALIPVMTLSTIDAMVGSVDVKIQRPVDGDCGVTGAVSFSPTPTVNGWKAPSAGGVPMTVTSKVVLLAV